jgi:hypothetical protein
MLQLGNNARFDSRDQRGAFIVISDAALASQPRRAVFCVLANAEPVLGN